MSMRKKERKQASLYVYSVWAMILLAVCVLITAFVMVRIADHKLSEISLDQDTAGLTAKLNGTAGETEWKNIKASRYLGIDGYFELLDQERNVIYRSDGGMSSSAYTGNVLNFIPGSDGIYYFMINKFTNPDGTESYQLFYDSDVSSEGIVTTEMVIEAQDGQVIFANTDGSRLVLSADELETVASEFSNGLYLQKDTITTKDGTELTAVYHCSMMPVKDYDKAVNRIYITSSSAFLCVVILLVVLITMYQRSLISRPLVLLDSAMKDFAAGEHGNTVKYEGPREFQHVIDTYNDMSVQLKESEDRRHHMEEERQTMIADISHDLRTPVTVISGYAEALNEGMVPQEEVPHYLQAIRQKAANLSDLINSFYEYSRLEHPQFHLERKHADLCEYFRAYLAGKYEELEMQGYHLETELPDEVIMASFDPVHLRRVFENLITNSIRHNMEGITIFASMERKDDHVKILIGDNGQGILEETRVRVFEPFEVGNEARTSGRGTGLGLAIAKKVVTAHGGTIRIADDPYHRWSVLFEIILPLEEQAESAK